MPDFSHMFDSWKPSAYGILLLDTVLPITAAFLAVAVLVLLLLLRRLHGCYHLAFTGILVGDCLLLVLSAGFVALSLFRQLGLTPAVFVLLLVPILKFALDGALLAILRELGTPLSRAYPPNIPKKAILPWVAGIASMVASLSIVAFGILFGSDVYAKHASTQILSVALMLLAAGGVMVCLGTSLVVAVTAPRRLLRSGASRGTVALSRLVWLFPGGIVLFGLVSTILRLVVLARVGEGDGFGLIVLIGVYCMNYVFPTAGVICLASAYLRHAKEKKSPVAPVALDTEEASGASERKDVE